MLPQSKGGKRFMADWNAFKDKAIGFTRTGVGKAKELGEIARLNLDNLSEEEKIRQAHIEIGQRYVELHPEDFEPGFEVLFDKLATAKKAIAANKEKIANIKAEGNVSEEELKQLEDDEPKPE